MRFLILFIFLVNNAFAGELSKIKNIIIHKDPKTYDNVIFLDNNDQKINLKKFKGNLILINFWATWCEPCKKEMPSLDKLQIEPKLENLKIFVINVGRDNKDKTNKFLNELDIRNLKPYFDGQITLAKVFALRGIPTTVLFNKDGKEFARIVGSIDFNDIEFIDWLKSYN
tara:strand:- start:120 stop:629 length:510 start_codon:yes stop_codon:yes gene_type:complete